MWCCSKAEISNNCHCIEQLLCQMNCCTFRPDDQPLWKMREMPEQISRTQGGLKLSGWLEALVYLLISVKQNVLLQRRQICPRNTDVPLISFIVLQESLKRWLWSGYFNMKYWHCVKCMRTWWIIWCLASWMFYLSVSLIIKTKRTISSNS